MERMTKTLDQIENELDASRNALAVRQLNDMDEDPTPVLLWAQALDNAQCLANGLRNAHSEANTFSNAAASLGHRLSEVTRQRDAAEAEQTRLSQEVVRLHNLVAEVNPEELERFCQQRAAGY